MVTPFDGSVGVNSPHHFIFSACDWKAFFFIREVMRPACRESICEAKLFVLLNRRDATFASLRGAFGKVCSVRVKRLDLTHAGMILNCAARISAERPWKKRLRTYP